MWSKCVNTKDSFMTPSSMTSIIHELYDMNNSRFLYKYIKTYLIFICSQGRFIEFCNTKVFHPFEKQKQETQKSYPGSWHDAIDYNTS